MLPMGRSPRRAYLVQVLQHPLDCRNLNQLTVEGLHYHCRPRLRRVLQEVPWLDELAVVVGVVTPLGRLPLGLPLVLLHAIPPNHLRSMNSPSHRGRSARVACFSDIRTR